MKIIRHIIKCRNYRKEQSKRRVNSDVQLSPTNLNLGQLLDTSFIPRMRFTTGVDRSLRPVTSGGTLIWSGDWELIVACV